jgi:tetratricopeptide (TPR) repeat protein
MPYDVFISYSRRDNGKGDGRVTELVEGIGRDFIALAGRPLRTFFDRQAIESMDDWRHKILQGLRESRLLLACLSPSYLNSEYCKWEFVEYLKNEVGRGFLGEGVAPIYFVSVPGWDDQDFDRSCDGWVAELRRRQCIDLRPWFLEGAAALLEAEVQDRMAQLNRRLAEQIRRGERADRSPGNVDAHNPHFVGRVAELRLLRENFVRPGTIGVLTAVHGLGGLGKTAFSLEYAHDFAHEYGGGLWQVRCEGRDDLRAAVVTLAPALRVDFSETAQKDVEFQFQRILAELRHHAETHEPPRCLLLLDNVDQPELLDPNQTQRLPGADWLHIIVTTRLGKHDLFGEHKDRAFLAVDELPEPDALALMEQYQPGGRFRDESEREAASEIVRILGCFTLAVEAAALFLGYYSGDVSCAEFLRRLEQEELGGLEDATTEPRIRVRHQEKRLTATLLPTLERLSPPEQLALDYAALLPPDCVSWEWLEVLVGDQYEEFAQAVPDGYLDPWTSLRAHLQSLRLLNPASEPENARIHRLVQAVVQSRPEFARDRLRGHLIEYALQRCRALEQEWTDREVLWELKPLTAWALLLIEQDPHRGVFLQSALGQLLVDVAQYKEAEPLLEHALKVSEELFGPFHLNVANPLNALGLLFFRTNRLDDAEPLLRRALATTRKELGADHPRVATALINLAALLHDTNRMAEAEPLMRRALAIDELSYGEGHPDVAGVLSNLARLLHDTNRLAEAEPLMRRALAIDEQSYGEDHTRVARDLNNLARLLQDTNRLAEAEPLMRRALAIDELSYGEDHPNVATALNNLAQLLKATNRLAEAEPLMRRVVNIFQKFGQATGYEHPHSRGAIANYCGLLQAMNMSQPEMEAKVREMLRPDPPST